MPKPDLKRFTGPESYPADFNHNFSELAALGEEPEFRRLAALLAAACGLREDEALLDIQKFLCTANEHFPAALKPDWRQALVLPLFLARAARYTFSRRPEMLRARSEIIVDSWYPGAADDFYGASVMRRLEEGGNCSAHDFSGLEYFTLPAALRALPDLFRALLAAAAITTAGGPALGRFIYRFFSWHLTGRELAATGVKLVVSGNDNGCPPVKVKSAGAQSLLVQNGLRTYLSDTCFKQADHYASMGLGRCLDVFAETGCKFGRIRPLGSIRLANFLEKEPAPAGEAAYDILLVESGYLMVFFNPGYFNSDISHFSGSFSAEAELKALGLVTELARGGNLRIAVQTQFKGELALIKKLGYHSDRITYFERGERPVYRTMMESSLVLSTVSTVCMEALGLGKKAGYINFSGNSNINRPFRELNAEYNEKSSESFETFLGRLRQTPAEAIAGLVRQEPDYAAALAGLAKSIAALVPRN
jgi:hypothetical protein